MKILSTICFFLALACTDVGDIINNGGKRGQTGNSRNPVVDTTPDIETPPQKTCGGAGQAPCVTDIPAATTGSIDPNSCYRVSTWNSSDYKAASGGNTGNRYPSFAIGKFFYVNTKGYRTVVLTTKEDGTPDTWADTGFKHGGIHGFTAVSTGSEAFMFRNGHIGKYSYHPTTGLGVNNDEGQNEYTFYESDPEQAFDGFRWIWDSAVYAAFANGNKFFIHLGGWGSAADPSKYRHFGDIFRAKLPLTPHGTTFDRLSGFTNPEGQPGQAAFMLAPPGNSGFIFVTGQSHDQLHRIGVNDSGDLQGSWSALEPSGVESSGQGRGDLLTIGRSLLWIRGAKVNTFDVSSNGDLGSNNKGTDLPSELQVVDDWGGQTDGPSWGVIKDKLYLTSNEAVYWTALQKASCP